MCCCRPSAITAKDEADLRFGIGSGVDLVALSFVQSGDDVASARAIAIDAGRPTLPLVAKLERPEAIRATCRKSAPPPTA